MLPVVWLDPPLAALQHIKYFRFHGWRHICASIVIDVVIAWYLVWESSVLISCGNVWSSSPGGGTSRRRRRAALFSPGAKSDVYDCLVVQCSVSDCLVRDSSPVRWMSASSSTLQSLPRPTSPSSTSDAKRSAWNVRRRFFVLTLLLNKQGLNVGSHNTRHDTVRLVKQCQFCFSNWVLAILNLIIM